MGRLRAARRGRGRAQVAIAADAGLVRSLRRAAAAGAVVFGVCAGYQIRGTTFVTADGVVHGGAGLLDVATERSLPRRAVGEVVATAPAPDGGILTGFENHGGGTCLGPGARPLARVVAGVGNGDGTEGAVAGHVFGTYLHGPVLARNPALALRLLGLRVGSLVPPELPEVDELRRERIAAALPSPAAGGRVRRWLRPRRGRTA